jgi:DNA-binding CsgD family transcriptional regulator
MQSWYSLQLGASKLRQAGGDGLAISEQPAMHVQVRLSARQHEVARGVAEGMTDAQIAERLGISPRTVRMHCDALRSRLGVARRRQVPYAYWLAVGTEPFAKAGPS